MKGIQQRFYREQMGRDRFSSFIAGYKDSDLWIGIDKPSFKNEMKDFAQHKLVELRKHIEVYITENPQFASSFVPVEVKPLAHPLLLFMAAAGKKANTGPMAAVAGAIAEFMGNALQEEYEINEIVIENGGDIYLKLQQNITMAVYAGSSPLSGKTGIEIPASITPLGVCTSAGTVGPSISFGKADAVVAVSKNTAIADAFATATGNMVKSAADINNALAITDSHPEIISLIVICEGSIGIKGKLKLQLINRK